MWSLRTATRRVASKAYTLRSAIGACCTNLEVPSKSIDETQYSTSYPTFAIEHPERTSAIRPLSSPTILFQARNLSSHSDTNSVNKESEELEGFSDLDTDAEEEDIENELTSESDGVSSNEEENTMEEEVINKSSLYKRQEFPLYGLILTSPRHTLEEDLEKWVKEGNTIKREDIISAVWRFRIKKLFGKAFQFMKWLEKTEHYEFIEVDYATLVDLCAKVHGLNQAEKFIEEIPQSMRTEHVYRSLLACCASEMNVPKAEKIFNKMRDLNFPLTAFACNQLLLLYKKTDKKKIADVLLMMEKENLKPTLFTYKMLIDTKGLVGDIPAIEQLLDTMKEDGIEPDVYIKYLVAKHYIKAGLTKKAEELAREMEGGDVSNKLIARKFLLNLYGELGAVDDVERVWEVCRVKPTLEESIAVMLAQGKLGKVEDAENMFLEMFKQYKNVSQKCYNCMLNIYAENKMLNKAKDLVDRMSREGIRLGAIALDMLVKLHVEEGDVEKADSLLQNWVQKNQKMQMKPMYHTYLHLLEAYAKKGDYHNAEKMLYLMRQIGYSGRVRMYELVLGAYMKANVPAYGFRDRLRADNVFPKHILAEKLMATHPFKRAPVTEVLE